MEYTVATDPASLKWLSTLSSPSGRLARWLMRISQFKLNLVYRKRTLNVVADALSRFTPETSVRHHTTLKPGQCYVGKIKKIMKIIFYIKIFSPINIFWL